MSLVPEEKGKLIVEYSPDDTFDALDNILNSGKAKFIIKDSNAQSHSFFLKSCASMKSSGENLRININPSANGSSEIIISSKSRFGLLDLGKNQENINNITMLLNEELNSGEYEKIQPAKTFDIPEQIKKLASLKDAGILTADEFNSKKAELLARM